MTADRPSSPSAGPVCAVLPEYVLRNPAGAPAVVLVRSPRGWSVLGTEHLGTGHLDTGHLDTEQLGGDPAPEVPCCLPLVEAMSLADLVAAETGAVPEPDRPARLAARGPADGAVTEAVDPRDAELATLRRTVGQLEHALAARVSIERAIGVLAERHGTGPRDAFDELRRRARAQGRPAQDLAREVLDALPPRVPVPDQRTPGDDLPDPAGTGPAEADHGSGRAPTARRVSRRPRRAVTPGAEPEGVS